MTPNTRADKTVLKVTSFFSPHGPQGEKYLASGRHVNMRLWEDEPPGGAKAETVRPFETVGYVLKGKAELHLEGQMVLLEAGDSYVVPAHSHHRYHILETFSAVEASSPPSFLSDCAPRESKPEEARP